MAFVFDGRAFSEEGFNQLKKEVDKLLKKGIKPKLVTLLIGNDPASVLYVNLKKAKAEEIGIEVVIKRFCEDVQKSKVSKEIKKLNLDKNVHGIMIQLPLPVKYFSKKDRSDLINLISKEKDVDGLRDDSVFLTPTVKAVLRVIRMATPFVLGLTNPGSDLKVAVVGSKGFEGQKISKVLKEMGYKVIGIDKDTKDIKSKTKIADILISVAGSPGIIGKDEIKEGCAVIDVGSPIGDVRVDEVLEKAIFLSKVPGGVGPVTILCLLENLIDAALARSHRKP